MTNWRDNGQRVRAAFKDELQRGFEELEQLAIESGALDSFRMAVIRAFGLEENRAPLIAWLRSEQEITPVDREWLAKALELNWALPRRARGRPKNRNVRDAALTSDMVYTRWRRLNDEMGVSDYGHRGEMRDESIRIALELDGLEGTVKEGTVRLFMDRPTPRRK